MVSREQTTVNATPIRKGGHLMDGGSIPPLIYRGEGPRIIRMGCPYNINNNLVVG